MNKYVLYSEKLDDVMFEGTNAELVTYDSEESAAEEIAALNKSLKQDWKPKSYEFYRKLVIKKEKEETENKIKGFVFRPPSPQFYYNPPDEQKPFLVILADEAVEGSRCEGMLIKDFDTLEEAMTFALRSNRKLCNAFPQLAYYIYNPAEYVYYAKITKEGSTVLYTPPAASKETTESNANSTATGSVCSTA